VNFRISLFWNFRPI